MVIFLPFNRPFLFLSILGIVLTFLIFYPVFVSAADLMAIRTDYPLTGTELAQRVYDREIGDDSAAQMVMVLISKSGRKREREFTTYRKDYGSLIKQLIRFTTPADIAGTGFLNLEIEGGDTDQFLYLPALRRVRRIVSSQKSHRFVNTDFTYEDMERRPVEDSDHQITGEEKIGDTDCWVLESRPKKEAESQYAVIKGWVAKEIYLPVLIENFNKKGSLIKKYRVNRLENIQNIWTEIKVVMEDLNKKHRTIMKIRNIVYNTRLSDHIFTKQNLENW